MTQQAYTGARRRKAWHFLSDHGAPFWLWSRFVGSTWKPCGHCGWRGIGRWKRAARYGGGQPAAHFCTSDHATEVTGMF